MKKKFKVLLSLSLSACLSFFIGTTAFANELTDTSVSSKVLNTNINNKFSSMTNEQLNQYIDNIKKSFNNTNMTTSNISGTKAVTSSSTGTIGEAWLAAAQIARNAGYPCAASLVECSVNNYAFTENSALGNSALFHDKIITTSAYKSSPYNTKSQSSLSGSIVFNKSDNSDLFYALHNVNISVTNTNPGTIYNMCTTKITDTFDFAYDNNYDSLFTTLVNNWAWLCQQTSVLNKIPVTISWLS